MLDVLSVSDMCVDLIVKGNVRPQFGQVELLVDDCDVALGGSSNIFSIQFAKLGGKSGVIGVIGNDLFGDFAWDTLQSSGIDLSHVSRSSDIKTGVGIILCDNKDRAILTYPGSIDAVTIASLSESLSRKARHWHICSYFLLKKLRPHWKALLHNLKSAHITTSLDTNWDPENSWEGVADLLPSVDIFLPNAAEACAITNQSNSENSAMKLARICGGIVVVKCGAEGILIAEDGEKLRHFPAQKPPFIVDTVGAGDCFDAGFLRGYLLSWPLDECVRLGIECATASLSAAGGITGQLQRNIQKGRV